MGLEKKGMKMKKLTMLLFAVCSVFALGACCHCEREPIIEQNHKLIVPPNFGQMPK